MVVFIFIRFSRSRFELFTMIVGVAHPDFDVGSIFGNIWVKDANLERADGWKMSDDTGSCFVSYFNHEWHKPLDIDYGSCIPFGDPSCRRSVSVSSSFEVDVVLHALNKEKDQVYLIFHGKHVQPLSKFWDEDREAECGTIQLESEVGRVLVNYILLKTAVDASMELTFGSSNPTVPVRISGSIFAYYGDNVAKDNGGILGQYKAEIFRANNFELTGEQVLLPLHKSLLAVPANGCLKIEAFLMDVESKKVIVRDKMDFRARPGNADDNWCIKGGEYSFNLRVAWS